MRQVCYCPCPLRCLREEFFHYPVQVEGRGFLTDREFLERLHPLGGDSLSRHHQEDTISSPLVKEERVVFSRLERVRADVEQLWYTHLREGFTPNREASAALL